MKKIIAALILSITATSAFAHEGYRGDYDEHRAYGGYHEGYERHEGYRRDDHDGFGRFIGPALIGGLIGYGLSQPHYVQPQVVYAQPPVAYAPPQVAYSAPYGYHYETILDAGCNCYRNVLVGN